MESTPPTLDQMPSNAKKQSSSLPVSIFRIQDQNFDQESLQDLTPSPASELLRQYFNFGHFFGLFPYKFMYNQGRGSFKVQTSRSRRVFAGVAQALVLYRVFSYFRMESNLEFQADTSPNLGRIATVVFGLGYKATFFATFWVRKEQFLALFNIINEVGRFRRAGGKPMTTSTYWRSHASAFGLCATALLGVTLCTIVGHTVLHPSEWAVGGYYVQKMADYTRVMFFFTMPDSDMVSSELTLTDYALALAQVAILFYYELDAFYSDLSILVHSVTFKILAHRFMVEASRINNTPSNVLERYAELKSVVDKMNVIVGPILFGCLLEEIVFYAIYIAQLMSASWILQARYIFFLTKLFTGLCVAASAGAEVCSLADWLALRSNSKQISSGEITVLVVELGQHRVAMRSLGLFTVTYGFIGTIISLIATYAVICMQLRP